MRVNDNDLDSLIGIAKDFRAEAIARTAFREIVRRIGDGEPLSMQARATIVASLLGHVLDLQTGKTRALSFLFPFMPRNNGRARSDGNGEIARALEATVIADLREHGYKDSESRPGSTLAPLYEEAAKRLPGRSHDDRTIEREAARLRKAASRGSMKTAIVNARSFTQARRSGAIELFTRLLNLGSPLQGEWPG